MLKSGQDMEFFLKYVLCCKSIYLLKNIVAKYRILSNSVSTTYTNRIFDVEKVFRNVRAFFTERNEFKKRILPVEMASYANQMKKYKFFAPEEQKDVIEFFKNKVNHLEWNLFSRVYIMKRIQYIRMIIEYNKNLKKKCSADV